MYIGFNKNETIHAPNAKTAKIFTGGNPKFSCPNKTQWSRGYNKPVKLTGLQRLCIRFSVCKNSFLFEKFSVGRQLT